jgi:hypothetical protein
MIVDPTDVLCARRVAIMGPRTSGRIVGWLVGILVLGSGVWLRAGEGPSERMLASVGLKRVGEVFILESESEVQAKAQEVRQLSRQLKDAVARQRSTLSEKEYQATIKQLNDEINQLRAQSNAANQMINQLPRRRGYPVNNYVAEEQQELNYYKNVAQAEINERTAFLNELRSKPYDSKARIKADNDVRERQEGLHQGAQDLRKLVEATSEKYATVAKEPRVKKWLDTPEGRASVKPKLGPSRAFQLDVKMLEQIERSSGSDEPAAPAGKATRKGRRAKAKRATAKDDSGSPF